MTSQTRLQIKIGNKIKAMRENKGISLDDFAKQAGLSKSSLNYIERGISDPRLSSLYGCAKALDIKLEDILKI